MTLAMADGIFISTTMVAAEARNDFWRQVTRPVFDTLPLLDGRALPLEGAIRSRPLASLLIGSVSFNGQRYSRDRRVILQGGLDSYLVQFFVSGTMKGDFGGTDVKASVGDICILDLAQSFRSQVDAGSRFSAAIPRPELEKAVGSRNLHGAVLKAAWPMTRLIATYLGGLVSLGDPLPGTQALAVQEALITLLAAALKGEVLEQASDYAPLSVALRQRVLTFIEQNIGAKNLSPEFIQRRFNVSRAHLYRAFAADGGVAKVVQDRRLDAALVELNKVANSSRSISEIAYSLGFSSGNQLLRGFRTRFAMTPSEAREAAASHQEKRLTPNLQAYFTDIRNRTSQSLRYGELDKSPTGKPPTMG